MIKSTKITIGTDPELIFSDKDGKIVKAGSLIKDKDGEFGVDGHQYIAELRPKHAIYPQDLVENIRATLSKEAMRLGDLTWLAGPYVLEKPMGGHLHYGVPYRDRYIEALDYQLGFLLALSEPEEGARWRRTNIFPGSHDPKPYGQLSNYRKKPWGFEYRTPSSPIVSPGVALATIAVGKAIVFEEVERAGMAWSLIPRHLRTELTFSPTDFHHCKKDVFYSKLDAYWRMLQRMKYFQKGMEGFHLWSAVSYFKDRVFPSKGYIQGKDLKQKWGLQVDAPSRKARKKPIMIVGGEDFWGGTFKVIRKPKEEKKSLDQTSPEQAWQIINLEFKNL
jgi:phiEco32-like amidoligase-type 2 protein